IAHRVREEDLRGAGGDETREREQTELTWVRDSMRAPLQSDRGQRHERRDAGHEERTGLAVAGARQPCPERDRHHAEGRGRQEGERAGGYGLASAPRVYRPATFQSMKPFAPASRAA